MSKFISISVSTSTSTSIPISISISISLRGSLAKKRPGSLRGSLAQKRPGRAVGLPADRADWESGGLSGLPADPQVRVWETRACGALWNKRGPDRVSSKNLRLPPGRAVGLPDRCRLVWPAVSRRSTVGLRASLARKEPSPDTDESLQFFKYK